MHSRIRVSSGELLIEGHLAPGACARLPMCFLATDQLALE
jgi:hypothetical protein